MSSDQPTLHGIDLRTLAERQGPERAFLSLYLSGPDALGSLDHRIRKVRDLLAGNDVELEYFEENLRLVEERLEATSFKEGARCLFACWATGYLQDLALDQDVPDLLWVDSSPYIRPLAELQDEHETFVVVAADNDDTYVYLVTSAHPNEGQRVKGDVKNDVKVGGWSQKRYQRRREKELQQYASEVADVLSELEQQEDFDRVLLLGSDETMREIEAALPAPVRDKLVAQEATDLSDEDRLWHDAFELFFEEERAAERALWNEIQGEYLRGGQAAVGPEEVLQAAAVGRVDRMIVTRDAKIAGIRCRSCENLSPTAPEACPVCGSDDVFTVDLVNELVELLATSSATAEFSDPLDGLTGVGHVAALLRY